MSHDLAVFCDIGDTPASPAIENGQIIRLDVYPFVPPTIPEFGVHHAH